jgi:hypothetical protein
MGRNLIQEFSSLPHVPSVGLDLHAGLQVVSTEDSHQHNSPERAVLLKVEVTIVVHRVHRTTSLEIVLVTSHISLKLDSVLTAHQVRVLVVVVQEVVNLGLMELSRETQGSATDGASARLGYTTSIKTKRVHIVLFALLSQFSHTSGCVGAGGGSLHGCVTSSITHVRTVILLEVFLRLNSVVVRLLSL